MRRPSSPVQDGEWPDAPCVRGCQPGSGGREGSVTGVRILIATPLLGANDPNRQVSTRAAQLQLHAGVDGRSHSLRPWLHGYSTKRCEQPPAIISPRVPAFSWSREGPGLAD